jgi:hypothetical protein
MQYTTQRDSLSSLLPACLLSVRPQPEQAFWAAAPNTRSATRRARASPGRAPGIRLACAWHVPPLPLTPSVTVCYTMGVGRNGGSLAEASR